MRLAAFFFLVAPSLAQWTKESCGVPRVQPALDPEDRIVGGMTALPGSWPWQAQVRDKGGDFCGGILISDQHVLTAAHCVRQPSLKRIIVSLGSHRRSTVDAGEKFVRAKEICIHPRYNDGVAASLVPDIAIIKLNETVKMTDTIQPACLPKNAEELPSGATLYLTGWGITDGQSTKYPSELKQAMVKAIPINDCRKKWRSRRISELICADHEYGSICEGDSGGPVVRNENGKWTVHGIISTRPVWGCGSKQGPQSFVKVSAYMKDFIEPYTDPRTSSKAIQSMCRIVNE